MIFKPGLAKLVARGAKTETRRPIKPGEQECRYRVQHTYAVQSSATSQDRRDGYRGRARTLLTTRILVTHTARELLSDLTDDAAIREGFTSTIDFAHYWMRLYDRGWPPQVEALCPRCNGHAHIDDEPCPNCELGVIDTDETFEPHEIWQRFLDRHGATPVWVIRFELEQDPIRLLTPTTRPHGSELGYTTETYVAMDDEPESIDVARIHPDWKTRTRAHHRASLQSVDGARLAGLRTDEERLIELRAIAAERKVDIRDDINAIDRFRRRRIDAIERKIRDKTDGRAA